VTPYYKFTTGDCRPAVVYCRRINTHVTGIIIASVHILRKQPVLWCYVEAARARNVTDSGDRSSAPETNGRYRAFTGPLLYLAGRSRDSFRPTTASSTYSRAPKQNYTPPVERPEEYACAVARHPHAWPTAGRCRHHLPALTSRKSDPSVLFLFRCQLRVSHACITHRRTVLFYRSSCAAV